RTERPHQTHRLPAVGRLAHHPKSLSLQEGSERLSEDQVVVGEENADGHHRLGLALQIDDGPRGHRSHFFTVTVVPRPTADSMSNSSVSRLTPGSLRPRPPEVEKPLCSARAAVGI